MPMAVTTDYEPEILTRPDNERRDPEWPRPNRTGGVCALVSRNEKSELGAPRLQVSLLGGFRVERVDARPTCEWPRRSAKTLTKLLAACPGHALHREQVTEILWPGIDLGSALNSFGKALHAARHALEPELPPRSCSSYLRLSDGMLRLDTHRVVIDADRFERLAEDALRCRDVHRYEAALAAYTGELLPEDRYEDWCAERRTSLAELRVRLLLGLADALEDRSACIDTADLLRQVVAEDPTREEVHRRLIRLWAELGKRDQAVRQFHACQEALRRDLDLLPQRETVALYQDVLAGRVPTRSTDREREGAALRRAVCAWRRGTPLIGREQVLGDLLGLLERRDGRPPMLILTGEAGVGKTRLLETLAGEASRAATVLRGEVGAHVSHLPCGPIAAALEGFVATRSEGDRQKLARRYPALVHLVPSLTLDAPVPSRESRVDHLDFLLAIVRALSDFASARPLLLVVDDLHEADPLSLDVLRYFAHLGRQRRWLFVAAVREEELQADSRVAGTLDSMLREDLCAKLKLPCLARAEGHELIRALSGHERINDEVAQQIYDRSGGNPLFIEALVSDALERCEPSLANRRWGMSAQPGSRVPARVRLLVASQLRALDDIVRRVLTLAAAAETAEISLDRLLAAAAGLEPPIGPAALFDALDQALSLRILEEREGGCAFRHPLVRAVLFQELSKHRREELQAAWCGNRGERSRRLRVTASRT
jgi:DNA-binding SARP family transcriptional activator